MAKGLKFSIFDEYWDGTSIPFTNVIKGPNGRYNATCNTGDTDLDGRYFYNNKEYSSSSSVPTGTVSGGSTVYSTSYSAISVSEFNFGRYVISAGTGGTVSVNSDVYNHPGGSFTVGQGQSLTFGVIYDFSVTAQPVDGYYFTGWSDGEKSASRSWHWDTTDKNLTAQFSLKPTLTVSATTGGTVSTSGFVNGGRVDPDRNYSMTATPADRYKFAGWYIDGGLVSTSTTYTVHVGTSNVLVQARFSLEYHPVSVEVSSTSPSGSGGVKMYIDDAEAPNGTEVREGNFVRVVATPTLNYKFSHWLIDGTAIYQQDYTFAVQSYMSASVVCAAVFVEKIAYGVTITKENPAMGSISLSDAERTYQESDDVIEMTGHDGVAYTATATVHHAPSLSGNELNMLDGWFVNNVRVSTRLTYQFTEYAQNGVIADKNIVAKFRAKDLYPISVNIPLASQNPGSVTISPSADAIVGGVMKWLEGTVTLTATVNDGWKVDNWNVIATDGSGKGFVSQGVKAADGTYKLNFTLDFAARVTVNFARIPCSVFCTIDPASFAAHHGNQATAEAVGGGSTDGLVYNDRVTFKAIAGSSDYQFDAWYSGGDKVYTYLDGDNLTRITTDQTVPGATLAPAVFTFSLNGDVSLVAKFKALVTLSVSSTASAHGTVSINGTSSATSVSEWITLGTVCEIGASPSDAESFFGAWYLPSDTSFSNPLDYIGQTDSLTVQNTTHYVARFVSEADALFVALRNIDNDTGDGNPDLGQLGFSDYTEEIDWATFSSRTGITEPVSGATRYFKFSGAIRTTLTASPTAGRGFDHWERSVIEDGEIGVGARIGNTSALSTVVNQSYVFSAFWGDPRPVNVTVLFGNGFTSTNGSLKLEGIAMADPSVSERTETDSYIRDVYYQGDIVRIGADIKNGYLFAGWFYDAQCEIPIQPYTAEDGTVYTYEDQEYVFEVSAPISFYAKFVEDTDAIYAWDASDRYKRLRWKSKVYVGSRPFNMVGFRVDANKYPVVFSVEMFSAPDNSAIPTGVATIGVNNDRSRRLPRIRQERFMQVLVEGDDEIDCVNISTSMEGLAI